MNTIYLNTIFIIQYIREEIAMSVNILRINASIFGENGVSSQLSNTLLQNLQTVYRNVDIVERDAASGDIPHFNANTLQQINDGKAELADTLIEEVKNADIILLAMPMYNFGVPSELKSWFDHIARAKVTFTYTENGPKGLLENKKVYVITTRGGIHRDKSTDGQMPFLNTMLSFVGLDDVSYIYAEGLNMSGDTREKNITLAKQQIEELVSEINSEALS